MLVQWSTPIDTKSVCADTGGATHGADGPFVRLFVVYYAATLHVVTVSEPQHFLRIPDILGMQGDNVNNSDKVLNL